MKVQVPDLVEVGSLVLAEGDNDPHLALLDEAAGCAYFAAGSDRNSKRPAVSHRTSRATESCSISDTSAPSRGLPSWSAMVPESE